MSKQTHWTRDIEAVIVTFVGSLSVVVLVFDLQLRHRVAVVSYPFRPFCQVFCRTA